MNKVRVEIVPWLPTVFGSKQSGRLILQEELPEGGTVRDLIKRLGEMYPEFGKLAFNPETQDLTTHVNVVMNDRLLELLDGINTVVEEGDTVILLPAYAGGRL